MSREKSYDYTTKKKKTKKKYVKNIEIKIERSKYYTRMTSSGYSKRVIYREILMFKHYRENEMKY